MQRAIDSYRSASRQGSWSAHFNGSFSCGAVQAHEGLCVICTTRWPQLQLLVQMMLACNSGPVHYAQPHITHCHLCLRRSFMRNRQIVWYDEISRLPLHQQKTSLSPWTVHSLFHGGRMQYVQHKLDPVGLCKWVIPMICFPLWGERAVAQWAHCMTKKEMANGNASEQVFCRLQPLKLGLAVRPYGHRHLPGQQKCH